MGYLKLVRLLMVLLPACSYAQLYVGPTLGLRGSTVSFFEARNKKDFRSAPGLGFDVGLMVSRRMKEKYTFNAQLLYTTKTKVVYGELDPLFRNRLTNRYLELPMTYTIEFKRLVGETKAGLSKSFYWFLGAGPTVSYWMGGTGKLRSSNLHELMIDDLSYKVVFNADSSVTKNTTNLLNISSPNRIQFAINFTGGVILEPNNLQKIIVSAHVELGQRFISDKNESFFTGSNVDFDPQRAKFHSVRFSVAYVLNAQLEDKQRGKSTIKNKSAANYRRKKR